MFLADEAETRCALDDDLSSGCKWLAAAASRGSAESLKRMNHSVTTPGSSVGFSVVATDTGENPFHLTGRYLPNLPRT